MEKIDLSKPQPSRRITALSYGPSRSGKTRFAGSWPRPLFLSDASEGGWETLRTMPSSVLYEPDVQPEVWALKTARDMLEAVAQAEIEVSRNKRFRTIVIDSLTFYADSYFGALEAVNMGLDKKRDPRQLYGDVNSHLRYLMIRLHESPCNIVWLCLDKAPNDTNPSGGPLLSGQGADKAPARCNYLFYHRAYQTGAGTTYEIRTQRYGAYPAGGRDGGLLPNPMEPSFRALEEALGIASSEEEKKPAPAVVRRPGNGQQILRTTK